MALTKSIREFIQRQSLMGLFLIALTPRLIWWIVVWLMTGDFTLFDSGQFILIADNLLQHGEFSRSTSSPFFPDIARTPGYPLFLAIFKSFGLSLKAVSFFQMLLGALIPVMIFRLSKKLKFDNGWIGFVLLCLSPSLILFVPILLSDGLFLLLFAIAIILLLKEKSWRNLILLGIVLGVMAITRPIGQFLPFLIIPYLLVQRVSWSRVLVFFFATAMLPALWSARNYHHFETFRLSSMSTNNLLMYNATAARASA
ncbi:MAG: glycosyltransferase family 39 protein [Flavobacteriales bacterium]|nr:glycosyltransferase family 39 protein [Flavobacteriales bacterium]